MRGPTIGERLVNIRRLRMWTQGRLAHEARVSPTTVSGIETGKISRPHFGTVTKLAEALGVDPRELFSSRTLEERSPMVPLSLVWAVSSQEEEFEEGLKEATLGDLLILSRELLKEHERLRRLYGEAQGTEQQRIIKGRIRGVAAQHGSVEASIAYHPDLESPLENRNSDK